MSCLSWWVASLVLGDELKQDKIIEGADISAHTTTYAVSFRVPPTDAHSKRLVAGRGLGSEKVG